MKNIRLEEILIKTHPDLDETWVQTQIAEDPSILGLGELDLRDKERIQIGAGRLDLLLQDPETLKRYEVEVQLGSLDESHIIRTIEYWDLERKKYPQYEHAAVIVAEEITSRFLNVIQLLNGTIPLIAIKMTAYRNGDDVSLTFVKVLDELRYGLVDEDEPVAEPTDRGYWEQRSSKASLSLVDTLFDLIKPIEPTAQLKYNRHYIGLSVKGSARNFIHFRPQKRAAVVKIKLVRCAEVDNLIEAAGLETLPYEDRWRQYRIRIDDETTAAQRDTIVQIATQAREQYGRSP
jgi:hypothetical protein